MYIVNESHTTMYTTMKW